MENSRHGIFVTIRDITGAYVVEGEEERLFRCTKCQKIKEHSKGTFPVPSLRMANVGLPGELLEVETSAVLGKHFCLPLKRSAVVGDQLYLEQRELVAMSGKRAMKVHMDALQAVETSRFALVTEVEHNEARDRTANELASVAEIPNELAMPWSSRLAQEGDASFGQGYLIYQDDTPDFEMAVFASPGLYAPSSSSGSATSVRWAQDAPISTSSLPH
uniref:Uncharacterized protein n=1 Tax=Plectus sambesii TaxID=2011161 RepID=A0A914XPU5_9BILA